PAALSSPPSLSMPSDHSPRQPRSRTTWAVAGTVDGGGEMTDWIEPGGNELQPEQNSEIVTKTARYFVIPYQFVLVRSAPPVDPNGERVRAKIDLVVILRE